MLQRTKALELKHTIKLIREFNNEITEIEPYQVVVHPDGGLNTRSEHKSKRIIDERKLEYNI